MPLLNVDKDGVMVTAELDERGREIPDPTPMAPPVGIYKTPSMIEQMRAMVRRELSDHAQQQGFESFEEAEDFEIDDDPIDPRTPYEAVFDPPPIPEVKQKEPQDGDASSEQGRAEDTRGGSGKSDPKRKGKSKSEQKSDHAGSVREGDGGPGAAEE